MNIYNYDRISGAYMFSSSANPDPLTPGSYLIPAYATLLAPPSATANKIPVFGGAEWTLQPDYRSSDVYSTETAEKIIIMVPGDLPDGATLLVPPEAYPKWNGSAWIDDVESAVLDKISLLEDYCDTLQQANFSWNDHNFYADKSAQEDFSKTLQRSGRLADSAPVPTPAPIYGKWKTADIGHDGYNIFVQMTVGQLKDLSDALYDHIAALWAKKDIHKLTIAQMVFSGATSLQIINYDITVGW